MESVFGQSTLLGPEVTFQFPKITNNRNLVGKYRKSVTSKGRGLKTAQYYKARINEELVRLLILGHEITGTNPLRSMAYQVTEMPAGAQNLGIYVINASPGIFVKFLGNQAALEGGDFDLLYEDAEAIQRYLAKATALFSSRLDCKDEVSLPTSFGKVKIEDPNDLEMYFFWVASPAAKGESLSSLLSSQHDSVEALLQLAELMGEKLADFHRLFLSNIKNKTNPFGLTGILSEFRGQLHGDLQPSNIFLEEEENKVKMTLIDVDGIGFYADYKQPVAADALYFLKQVEKNLRTDLITIYEPARAATIIDGFIYTFASKYSQKLLKNLKVSSEIIKDYQQALIDYTKPGKFGMGLVNQIGPHFESQIIPIDMGPAP